MRTAQAVLSTYCLNEGHAPVSSYSNRLSLGSDFIFSYLFFIIIIYCVYASFYFFFLLLIELFDDILFLRAYFVILYYIVLKH